VAVHELLEPDHGLVRAQYGGRFLAFGSAAAQIKAKLDDCYRKLTQYRAALDVGAAPATVAQSITQTEAGRAATRPPACDPAGPGQADEPREDRRSRARPSRPHHGRPQRRARRDADLIRDDLCGYVAERLGPPTAESHLGRGSQRVTYAS